MPLLTSPRKTRRKGVAIGARRAGKLVGATRFAVQQVGQAERGGDVEQLRFDVAVQHAAHDHNRRRSLGTLSVRWPLVHYTPRSRIFA